MSEMPTRRALLGAGIALAGTAGLASRAVASPAVASPAPASPSRAPSPARAADQYVTPDGPEVVDAENRRGAGPLRKVSLTAAASRLDLGGGLTVPTWAYGDRLPGEAVRITAGDTLELALANHLPQSTTMHWHGLSLRNDMDGVPALTQQPVGPGADFTYRFAVAAPGDLLVPPALRRPARPGAVRAADRRGPEGTARVRQGVGRRPRRLAGRGGRLHPRRGPRRAHQGQGRPRMGDSSHGGPRHGQHGGHDAACAAGRAAHRGLASPGSCM